MVPLNAERASRIGKSARGGFVSLGNRIPARACGIASYAVRADQADRENADYATIRGERPLIGRPIP